MADTLHMEVLAQGVEAWNLWRFEHPAVSPDLTGGFLRLYNLQNANLADADLSEAHLEGSNLSGACLLNANLTRAHLGGAQRVGQSVSEVILTKEILPTLTLGGMDITWTNLRDADLTNANLQDADISGADLRHAHLSNAILDGVNLTWANLEYANLRNAKLRCTHLHEAYLSDCHLEEARLDGAHLEGAKLERTFLSGACLDGANLCRATLVDADVCNSILNDCYVYGISAWGLKRNEHTLQRNLRVSGLDEAPLFVDDLEVAQFIYLMVRNPRIRDVLDTITQKGVLILGRFTPERKAVLDGIRELLRQKGYVPMLFDFEKPSQRDFDETVKVLAGLSRFVIADITNPSSCPLELQATVPDYMIPFVPIIQAGEKPFSMFDGLQHKYWWVLDELEYTSADALLRALDREVIIPALKVEQLIAAERAKPRKRRRIVD